MCWRDVVEVTGTSATLQLKLTLLQLLQLPHPVLPVLCVSLASLCSSANFNSQPAFIGREGAEAHSSFLPRAYPPFHFLFLTAIACTRLGGIRGREDPLPIFCLIISIYCSVRVVTRCPGVNQISSNCSANPRNSESGSQPVPFSS